MREWARVSLAEKKREECLMSVKRKAQFFFLFPNFFSSGPVS